MRIDGNSGPPLRADARRNRERVLEAARTRMASGDLSLALNELAKDIGVGVGTVYRHFGTRRSLVEALASERLEEMTSRARTAGRQPRPDIAFDGFITAVLRTVFNDPLASELLQTDDPEVAPGSPLVQELYSLFDSLLARAQRDGHIRDDLSPRQLVALICGIDHALRLNAGRRDEAADLYAQILLSGIRKNSPGT